MLNEILEKRHIRNWFFIIVALLVVGFLEIRYGYLPTQDNSLATGWTILFANIIDGIIVSIIATIFIGVFLFLITPEVVRKSSISIVEPRALPELFEKAFFSSEIWWYKGGCGRYLRTKTLPMMAKWARKSSHSREIRVIIIDPANDELCEAHATYRRSTASGQSEKTKWDAESVRNELYATIITTLIYQINEPLLRISLSLTCHFSTFRIDLSKEYVIITKEDRKAPALRCDSNTFFYQSYKDEIVLSQNQSKYVGKLICATYVLKSITPEAVKKILGQIGMMNPKLSEDSYNKIAQLCKEQLNPYE